MKISYNNETYNLEKISNEKMLCYVMKAKIGNEDAKEKLFVSFLPLIKKFAGKIYELKEDFIQELSVKFLQAINEFSFKRRIPFAGFIKNIVWRSYINFLRKEKNFSDKHFFFDDAKWEVLINSKKSEDDNSVLEKDAIIKLLEKLTIREQEILIYLYILCKTPKEISDYLEISVKTVSNTKKRALTKLRKLQATIKGE